MKKDTEIWYYDTYNITAEPAKWFLKQRGHGTLKSIVGHHGCPTRKVFEF